MARKRTGTGIYGKQGITGWLFTAPMIIVLGLFLFVPILMALYVSMTDWNGNGSPFTGGNAGFVGLENYTSLFTEEGLTRRTFMQSLGNTFYYVLLVVPLQTASALLLALVVNSNIRGKSFFRTAFYFPAVTSSIAISTVFLFLFSNTGAVNRFLGLVGIDGPQWFSDSRGTLHLLLGAVGVPDDPSWAQGEIFGRSLWEWLSGPSVALCVIVVLAVWTTTGTFMLLFLAALQDLPVEVDEAAALDGVSAWQKFRLITLPMLKPALFLVTTLGLIGTWQVFDQIYVMGKGAPAGTTMTPAFLSYATSFRSLDYGSGAAMAFIVFLIIIVLTFLQRRLLAEDREPRRRRRGVSTAPVAATTAAAGRGSDLVGAAPQTGGERR
ncbi:MAG: ABC transporter, permease protein 1 (cluster 1, maltose/g3p/polyamine/iron) [uncultured Frankineae bacterium]|uniref:ABC transporter, permease protein 1 (Cluster 1, maltose/g3p/polyamine/iron) n=1 Tax=uncultured Frankineae bacterium TaxID=437475 RepID=A0A6J4LG15_9ACTN|nr:MAG: ABC transporter, permease protein 1 (cluster 1, maltose/g3p/polyamine/iron) [uncultured Frankineae bacterium]